MAKARKRKVEPRKKTASRTARRGASAGAADPGAVAAGGAPPGASCRAGCGLSGWRSPAAFGVGFVSATYVVRLDRIVVARFAGRALSGAVPGVLRPCDPLPRAGLRARRPARHLERLGYREASEGEAIWRRGDSSGDAAGSASICGPSSIPAARSPPATWCCGSPGTTVEEIRELPRGREVGAVLLEPEQIGAYYGPDREQRDLVTLDEVPDHLVDAILAVEDQRFQTHPGIDVKRIAGALLANLRAGSIRRGAAP